MKQRATIQCGSDKVKEGKQDCSRWYTRAADKICGDAYKIKLRKN